jgi:eukaryotic-like serine/threonine-protein kinase
MNEYDLFNSVIKLSSAERFQFLDLACKDKPELRSQVDALLRAHFDSGAFLLDPDGGLSNPQTLETRVLNVALEHPGTIIAQRYKLLEAIGEGGMGSVWVAEQTQPVKRKVAVKLIKAGMDSKSVLTRFEAERQALAVMDHPNIAKVLDGGLTEQGRPYFVMEYVKGIPINEYCDSAKLDIAERLQLFTQVCQAVQHAHQKGIIHRDLKPSNILVAPYDDKPVPKVIDFGLAKAIHQSLTENTLYTGHGMVLGTPLYMSPEQAQLNNIDIDTRSDVYSLGVLLYELLTGSTPLEKQRFMQAAWDEMRRMIQEDDPPLPSQRLSSIESLPSVAACRHAEPARLTRLVRGELDWIVMKALEKERTRRYDSPTSFAADITRYLAGEPVMAAPPRTIYRIQKFVGRNKGKVLAASLVLLALVAGIASTSWQWYRAEQSLAAEAIQRKNAEDNQREAEAARAEAVTQQVRAKEHEAEAIKQASIAKAQEVEAKKQEAEARRQAAEAKQQATIAQAVIDFQSTMFAAADPYQLLGDNVTVVQAMEAAVQELNRGAFRHEPLVEAKVRNAIGNTLRSLGRFDDAEPNLQRSLAIYRDRLPAEHPDLARASLDLATLWFQQNKLSDAERLIREALAIYTAAQPGENPHVAVCLTNLASVYSLQNNFAEAESLNREALEIFRATLPAESPHVSAALGKLALLLIDQHRLAEAEPLLRESLAIAQSAYPIGHPVIADNLLRLASLLIDQDRLAESEKLVRAALKIQRSALPDGHPSIAESLNNLALLLKRSNKLAEAEPLYREALDIRRAALPAGHPSIAMSLDNLAVLLLTQNRFSEAEPLMRDALAIFRENLSPKHPDLATNLNNLAFLLVRQNRLAEAEPLYREALEIQKEALPPEHPSIAIGLDNLAVLLLKQDSLEEAESLSRQALAIFRAALPTGHPYLAENLKNLGAILLAQLKHDEAEPILREELEIWRKTFPDGHPNITECSHNLAEVYTKLDMTNEAIPLLKDWLESCRKTLPNNSLELAGELIGSARTLLTLKAWTEAEPLLREALAIREKVVPEAWTTFNTKSMLGGVLLGQKKYVEAETNLLAGYEGMKEREASIPPAGRNRLHEALTSLVQLYTDWHAAAPEDGHAEKAAQWQQKLDDHSDTLTQDKSTKDLDK